jgi:thiol-disulfide isomerase/thioredoxin
MVLVTAQANMLPDPAPLPNHPAPDLALPQLNGTPLRLRDLQGQVVLINVWATWCPPCRAEMPAIHYHALPGAARADLPDPDRW